MPTLRCAIYSRVSTQEQVEGYSLDAQQRACRDYANPRGWQIITEYADEGLSAHTDNMAKRPAFSRLLLAAEAHQFDVILVHKLDRFSRNLRITLESFERLARAGVAFVSLSEQIDYSSPSGRLFLTMLGGLAAFYSDNLATEVTKGKTERRKQGLYNGVLPFGYVREPECARAVVDERAAVGVRLAFRLAADGRTARQIAVALNDAGYRTTGNRGHNPWQRDSVRVLVANRFYIGELPGGVPGLQLAIVGIAEYDAAQAGMSERASRHDTSSVADHRRLYSLSGLLLCGRCGGKMQIWSGAGGKSASRPGRQTRAYCARRRQSADCDQPSIMLSVLEAQVAEWLTALPFARAEAEAVAKQAARDASRPTDSEARRRQLEARLDRLKQLFVLGDVTEAEYVASRDELRGELEQMPMTDIAAPIDAGRLAEIITNAATIWDAAAGAERNELLCALVEKVVVYDNRAEIFSRPDVIPAVGAGGVVRKRRDSDTSDPTRYVAPRRVYGADLLAEIAVTARSLSIVGAARLHKVSRQTVRKALAVAP